MLSLNQLSVARHDLEDCVGYIVTKLNTKGFEQLPNTVSAAVAGVLVTFILEEMDK
jgi:hypothetical protein